MNDQPMIQTDAVSEVDESPSNPNELIGLVDDLRCKCHEAALVAEGHSPVYAGELRERTAQFADLEARINISLGGEA